ncbi:hypothetical protein [Corynebacterium lubricantis]|uniref:hypothetical protein n=1 Tax=Corynebacterium lubricantis TaxID=541095 RepID=UPI00036AB06B|nr:hypothetical protein [Corynebacterium lubricantis]
MSHTPRQNPFGEYKPGEEPSSQESSSQGSSVGVVFVAIAVIVIAVVVAGLAVWFFQDRGSGTSADPTRPTNPVPTPTTTTSTTTSARSTSNLTGDARPDDSTGTPVDSFIMYIELPPAMAEALDPEYFADATLTKFTSSYFEGKEYAVDAVMTPTSLDDPEGLVNTVNAMTTQWCFNGFDAAGMQARDTRITIKSACEEEANTAEFASVIEALQDFAPHEIRQSTDPAGGYDAYFFDATESDLADLRAVPGVDIRAYVAQGNSEIVEYAVTPDGLERTADNLG